MLYKVSEIHLWLQNKGKTRDRKYRTKTPASIVSKIKVAHFKSLILTVLKKKILAFMTNQNVEKRDE